MFYQVKNKLKLFYFFLKKLRLRKEKIIIESNVSFFKTKFSRYNRVCSNSKVDHSILDRYTYISTNSTLLNTKIGAFCSIGPFVAVINGTHPINFVSTSPVFYSTRKQTGTTFVNENLFSEFNKVSSGFSAEIGNDVWIGYGVKIIEGVKVGDGVIILAGAYVTKDVEPFSIVGGIPAKHLKYRFNYEMREFLLKTRWWDMDDEWLKNHAGSFCDVEKFKDMILRGE